MTRWRSHLFIGICAGTLEWFGFTHSIWWLTIIAVAFLFRISKFERFKDRLIYVSAVQGTFFLLYVTWVQALGKDAWLALAFVCFLPWLLFAIPKFAPRGIFSLLYPAAVVAGIEFLRSTIPWGGFPWGNFAYSQIDGPFIGFAQLGGQYLVSATVVFIAGCTYIFFTRFKLRVIMFALLLGFVSSNTINSAQLANQRGAQMTPGYGAPGDFMTPDSDSNTQRILIVQGNAPSQTLPTASSQQEVFASHVQLTSEVGFHVMQGSSSRPNLVLWPENSTDIDPLNNETAKSQLRTTASQIDAPILIGGVTWGGTPYGPRNEGVLWPVKGEITQRYAKQHLVPFGEYLPFRSILTPLISRFNQIETDFIRGDHPGIFQLGNHTFGDLICFEIAYDNHVSELVRLGASFITLQTNNATYRGRGQANQQFAIARFRAVEHNRDIAVASTTGFSGFIDSTGRVKQRSQENQAMTLTDSVQLNAYQTYVDRNPNTSKQLLIVMLFLGIYGDVKKRRRELRITRSFFSARPR